MASQKPSDTPVAGGSITVGGLATKALDPGQLGYSSQSHPWVRPIFGSLFMPPAESGGKYQPGIAAGYEYADDGAELTLHLREGTVFSDGSPLDADAVVWNLNRHREPGMREGQFFKFVTDITASDKSTVLIKFSQPYGLLMDAFTYSSSGFIASPVSFEKMGADAFNAAPVGAGPFKIKNAEPGQQLEMVKNDKYWDAKHVYLDAINFTNEGLDEQAALVGLQAGSIQSINLNGTHVAPSLLSTAKGDDKLEMLSTPSTTVGILPMNTFAPPFDNLKARQAVAYCLDRESIAKNVMQGYATPAIVLAGDDSVALGGWEEGKELNPFKHDADKGSALVKELGGLSFTVVAPDDSTVLRAMQQQWNECGMDVKLSITNDYITLIQNGNYQIAYTTNSNASPNPALSTNYLDPDSSRNAFGWRDASITELIEKSKATIDNDEFTDLWHQIWTKLSKNVYTMPVIGAPYYVVDSACLAGVDVSQGVGTYANAYLTC